jgi:cysteine desulfurase
MIYLDNNATTRPHDDVIEAMVVCMREDYVNPSSQAGGLMGADSLRASAAAAMTRLLHAEDPECFVFTSGATESNNWVLGPIARSCSGRTVAISTIEHASVSEPAQALKKEGFYVRSLPVDRHGVLDLNALAESLSEDVAAVSVMTANNETGTLQPLAEIARILRDRAPGALFHTDATQAVGKVKIDLRGELEEIDLLSFSGHKFHGPKGVGGLYIRPGIEVPAMLLGGGQENGLRSGTTNTPALAGLAVAARLLVTTDFDTVRKLRDRFETALREVFPSVVVHSAEALRLPNTSCFSIPGLVASDIVDALASREIVVGNGSACSAGAMHPPKTLLAMGVPYDLATATLRVSLAASTDWWELLTFIEALADVLGAAIQERKALATS